MYTSQLADLKTKGGHLQFDIGNNLDFSPSTFGFSSRGQLANVSSFFPNAVADDYRDSLSDTTAPFGIAQIGGTVSGSIETSSDRDIFSVSLTAGQTYTFDLKAAGGGLDSYLRLLSSTGSQLAVNDDFGGSLNSRITFTAAQSGTYYLEARDYSSGTGAYSLTVGGSGGPVTPTDDFRDSLTDTTAPLGTVAIGGSTSGRVETGGDTDIFSVSLTAGQSYTFKLDAAGLSDPSLRLLSSNGSQLAVNNDFGGTKNSQITFTASSTGTFYLEAKGATSTLTGAYTVSAAQNVAPPTGGFDIKVNFTGDQQYAAIFEQAAARWEAAITADLPDYRSSQYGLIDDLLINASAIYIDGAGGPNGNVLGRAGPTELRSGSYLPGVGIMEFDSYDLAGMAANGTLLGVITHEMGHVLGLGTLWDTKGLKSGFAYTGANALAEYRTLSGNPNATSVPLETGGGPGTAGGHWSESVFGSELMTGYASGGMQMSRMTIGSLKDLGYGVNFAAADAYTLPGRQLGLVDGHSLAHTDEIFGLV